MSKATKHYSSSNCADRVSMVFSWILFCTVKGLCSSEACTILYKTLHITKFSGALFSQWTLLFYLQYK